MLSSYARLDNLTVGIALIDAVTDAGCRLISSPLAYLRASAEVYATRGSHRLRRILTAEPDPDTDDRILTVPDLAATDITTVVAIDAYEKPDVVHCALLALAHRCVIGTLDPAAYHRLGYLRTLDLT
ncbi:hypothetical protein [Actinoplanes sp. HUAS TT8]|uniref:hypothetical protein n=1 Tax=Actinoplanes sp. HUAS TT8 TaxID=3447453 RepID=UPI003F527993